MFSGIVEEMARLVHIEHEQENIHFTFRCSFTNELKIDQSIAHNGVCLTVVRFENETYTVTAMKETLERSNLGLLKVGDRVNIERSMMMNGRLLFPYYIRLFNVASAGSDEHCRLSHSTATKA